MEFSFEPIKISRNLRYTLEKEITTNKYYLSFLVSLANHRYAEYEEYYKISEEEFYLFISDEERLIRFVENFRLGINKLRSFRLVSK